MVKTVSKKEATTSPDGTKKQRKKQAKQEAKTMPKLERAKKNGNYSGLQVSYRLAKGEETS